MNLIFYGLLFMNLNLTINIEPHAINLIPTFAGILMVAEGMKQLRYKSRNFADSRNLALAAAVYSGFIWMMDLSGYSASLPEMISLVLGFVSTAINIFLCYTIVVGMKELEDIAHSDLNVSSLKLFFIIMVVLDAGTYVGLMMPSIALMCMVLHFFVAILFVWAFYKGGRKYNKVMYDVDAITVMPANEKK